MLLINNLYIFSRRIYYFVLFVEYFIFDLYIKDNI